jgi:hypothetical protein
VDFLKEEEMMKEDVSQQGKKHIYEAKEEREKVERGFR